MWIRTDKDRFVRTYKSEYNFIAGEVVKIENEEDIKFFQNYGERINFKSYIFDSKPNEKETNEIVNKKLFGEEKTLSKAEKKKLEVEKKAENQGIFFENPMIDSKK